MNAFIGVGKNVFYLMCQQDYQANSSDSGGLQDMCAKIFLLMSMGDGQHRQAWQTGREDPHRCEQKATASTK